ncbi:NADP-dependent oxidoreductase [Paracoccus versutus]|uniref:NADPH:quinone reductase-like Zn-dependent oxidoreductase n=1 Tax=Paracoccus versutus TaxID=34007 RepID=A0A3D9XS89_PARVE|nr:NADP-dependent oxidoreductase [Paracoccus versutus]REF73300.1 NADPH:quinone reductase-like Zn-dependent oxidoreductase [Paracoccus versutus]WGR54675.1 NADP-dependent oxidoreductase [Paracoccus versutus]
MKSVTFSDFGGAHKISISERPDPVLQAGEVIVQVIASSINPTDQDFLNGIRVPDDLPPPYTAGMDFSGRVISVADDVTNVVPGQTVIGVAKPRSARGGAQSEKIRVPAASVAAIAPDVDLVAAASVPMNALTALLALDHLRLDPGQTLLVTGATGMLGGLTVQFAKRAGLRVLANASESDRRLVSQLGANEVLPRNKGLEDAIRATAPEGLDGVMDGALISKDLAHLVRDGGRIVSPRAVYRIDDPRLDVGYVAVTSGVEDTDKISLIARLLERGELTPRLADGGVFDFSKALNAYLMAAAGGYRGRVVLTFGT